MQLQKFFGKLKKLNRPVLVRRVVGTSMMPRLEQGKLVIAARWRRAIQPGDVIIAQYKGREIIKRIERTEPNRVFVIGDNLMQSTDSRHFGWIPRKNIVAKVIWPHVHNL